MEEHYEDGGGGMDKLYFLIGTVNTRKKMLKLITYLYNKEVGDEYIRMAFMRYHMLPNK